MPGFKLNDKGAGTKKDTEDTQLKVLEADNDVKVKVTNETTESTSFGVMNPVFTSDEDDHSTDTKDNTQPALPKSVQFNTTPKVKIHNPNVNSMTKSNSTSAHSTTSSSDRSNTYATIYEGNENELGYEFRVVESDIALYSVEDCFRDSKRVVKVILAFTLFCVVLGTVMISKGSLLFISSQMNTHVAFKRTGLYNETFNTSSIPEDATNIPFYYDQTSLNKSTDICSKGPNGNCEQCGVPVCLAEKDPECAQKESVRWIWAMFLCQCTPYLIMFLRCMWKISFKKKNSPDISVMAVVMIQETLYTIGMFLLLYVLLPLLDATRALFLFAGTAFIPSLLKIFNRPKDESTIFNVILDVFAVVGQLVALLGWLLVRVNNEIPSDNGSYDMADVCQNVDFVPDLTTVIPTTSTKGSITFAANFHDVESTTNSYTEEPPLPPITYKHRQVGTLPETSDDLFLIPIILFLISLGYWENFIDDSTKLGALGKKINKFRHHKLWKTRTKTYFWVSLWKILLTFILLVMQYGIWGDENGINLDRLFNTSDFYDNKCGHYDYYYNRPENEDKNRRGAFQSDWMEVSAVQISMGIICFYAADLAIKGQMQVISFTLPLTIATPVTFFLLYWACEGCYNEWDFGTNYYWNCFAGHANYAEYMDERYAWMGFIWWASFIVLTRYLWFPTIENLAKLDRSFTYPVPDGAMLDQSIMMIRRRNDDERQMEKNKKKEKETDVNPTVTPGMVELELNDRHTNHIHQDEMKVGYVPTLTSDNPKTPFVYMCATMWHENQREMLQMLKSLFRMNSDQCALQTAKDVFKTTTSDYYQFEAHIFFDDSFEPHKPEETTGFKVNSFVKDFIETIDKAASSVLGVSYITDDPVIYETPYGGRIEWVLPFGDNKIVMHLKDKQMIRNRKRWSQIMYMHRILGLGIMDQPATAERKTVVSENTYILALDGDIDFKPDAVKLLLDLMKRNGKVAAACGRIHPIGAGPMVWYQKFEYSISHWLQKATEHVLGCVLCSPGCFSLFRASALMQDNVVQMYTTQASKPIHHVQYDQGEDRWLCTLLLQQGFRVEYSAAADAYTYAPEGFNEFFNQRRRWITSTFANLLDLLKTGRHTAIKNENISMIYIFYQGLLFAASILGPATIFMLIVGAFEVSFGLNVLGSFFLGIIPLIVFMILCFKATEETQLYYAGLLSVIFAILQMLVIVGISQQMVEDGICAPSSIFFLFVVGSFILCAILHPQEFTNLFHGFIYYLFIPSMYMVLIIYSLCNLHKISWGTREVKQTPTEKEKEDAEQQKAQVEKIKESSKLDQYLTALKLTSPSKTSGGCGIDCGTCCVLKFCVNPEEGNRAVTDTIQAAQTIQQLAVPQQNEPVTEQPADTEPKEEIPTTPDSPKKEKRSMIRHPTLEYDPEIAMPEDQMSWIDDPDIPRSSVDKLHPDEEKFWEQLIKQYLYPLDTKKEEKEKTTQGLLELRNKSVFSFFIIDMLLMVLVIGFTTSGLAINWTCTVGGQTHSSDLDPIGFTFVFIFGGVLAVQVVGMLLHRLFTFLQIIAATFICKTQDNSVMDEVALENGDLPEDMKHFSDQAVIELVKDMQKFEVKERVDEEDTSSDDENDDDDMQLRKMNMVRKLSRKPDILNNSDLKKIEAARYVKFSSEVFGRRPTVATSGTAQALQKSSQKYNRRASLLTEAFEGASSGYKESVQDKIKEMQRKRGISEEDVEKENDTVAQVLYHQDKRKPSMFTSKQRPSIFVPSRSRPSVSAAHHYNSPYRQNVL